MSVWLSIILMVTAVSYRGRDGTMGSCTGQYTSWNSDRVSNVSTVSVFDDGVGIVLWFVPWQPEIAGRSWTQIEMFSQVSDLLDGE